MISITMPAAATLRTRTLPTQGSPFALSADVWRDRARSAVNHNYTQVLQSANVPAPIASAVRVGLDAVKQAPPPRGVPR